MSMRMRFGVAAAALLGAALFGGVALAKSATVGEFLVEIAKAKSLSAADPATARAALTASGVVLPPLALDKALTEGDVVRIGGAVGVPVTSSNPTASFDASQVDGFIATFGKTLTGSGDSSVDPFAHPNPGTDKGRGKKKGHHKSPSDPV
jgi:hypothetical protein